VLLSNDFEYLFCGSDNSMSIMPFIAMAALLHSSVESTDEFNNAAYVSEFITWKPICIKVIS